MASSSNMDRVREWEEGLPSPRDLTPLSHCLISPELASAFSIASDKPRFFTTEDVDLASHSAFSSLKRMDPSSSSSEFEQQAPQDAAGESLPPSRDLISRGFPVSVNRSRRCAYDAKGGPSDVNDGIGGLAAHDGKGAFPKVPSIAQDDKGSFTRVSYPHDDQGRNDFSEGARSVGVALNPSTSEPKPDDSPDAGVAGTCLGGTDSSDGISKNMQVDEVDMGIEAEVEEAESMQPEENPNEDQASQTQKRPRLVWTPELHKRFVEAVAHLGIKNAVPKTIMQLMNVEGLTRENVASHLQKYRLYLKRMQGLSSEGPTSSDHLFASIPVPASLAASGYFASFPGHVEEVVQVPFRTPHIPNSTGSAYLSGSVNAGGSFAVMDPYPYNAIARAPPQRFASEDPKKVLLGSNQSQPASSSHHNVRMFPMRSK